MDIVLRIKRVCDVLEIAVLRNPSMGELRSLATQRLPGNPRGTLRGIRSEVGDFYWWDASLGYHDYIGSYLALQERFQTWTRMALRNGRIEINPPGF